MPKKAKTPPPPPPSQGAPAPLMITAQYIKDLSFENPSITARAGQNQEAPAINIQIETKAHALAERSFEVNLWIRVEATQDDQKVFLLDLVYAGIFSLAPDIPEEYIRPILMVECPRVLFPFARNIVATTTQEGGYSPLLINPIDFGDLYQRQLAQEEKAQEKPTVQ